MDWQFSVKVLIMSYFAAVACIIPTTTQSQMTIVHMFKPYYKIATSLTVQFIYQNNMSADWLKVKGFHAKRAYVAFGLIVTLVDQPYFW